MAALDYVSDVQNEQSEKTKNSFLKIRKQR